MTPILPRQLLWTDKQSMDEFFELDPVNEEFYGVFSQLRNEPFAVNTDGVKVFNEVYYQVTRMVYEHPMPTDLPKYITDIKANLGWNYSSELVMSMAYFLIALIDRRERPLNKFFTKAVNQRFFGCLYWKPFKHRFEALKKMKMHVSYNFKPNPYPVASLTEYYYRWDIITNCYDLSSIEKVLDLWNDYLDKSAVANDIFTSLTTTIKENNVKVDYEQVKWFLSHYTEDGSKIYTPFCVAESYDDYYEQSERIMQLEKEKLTLQKHIDELQAENERLNTLLEKKKRTTGKDRRFTLPQIVNYCKGCVQWEDVKQIVAMLNKLLRRNATEEDEKLVDSIETEFINRRYGNTFNNATVTMHNPQIDDIYRISGNETVNLGDE